METLLGWIGLVDWGQVGGSLAESGLRIMVILLLAYVFYLFLARLIPRVVKLAVVREEKEFREELEKRQATLVHVLTRTAGIILAVVALFTVLPELGVNIAPALAGLGIGGIALGFGAQSLVRDVLHGAFILIEDQYRKGDVVRVAGVTGLVEEVGLRRTVLRDLDGIVHSIPNGEITVSSNFTRLWSRVNMDVSVAYKEDLDHVMAVINRVGGELANDEEFGPLIIEPPKALRVEAFQDSGIAIKILGTTKPIRQWDVMGELRRRLKKAFDEEGIEIPFPHRVVYHRSEELTNLEKPPGASTPGGQREGDGPKGP
ncbi:MAG: mechanosensitive ion channel family protein [Chloroflexi bacterium]|nr:mechanosensitive ion channel family protein [Chloroflexota bacterium]